ncbi:MAG: hypothetical protein ABR577_15335, partial [Pyrinomonadaceae bacterium]
ALVRETLDRTFSHFPAPVSRRRGLGRAEVHAKPPHVSTRVPPRCASNFASSLHKRPSFKAVCAETLRRTATPTNTGARAT